MLKTIKPSKLVRADHAEEKALKDIAKVIKAWTVKRKIGYKEAHTGIRNILKIYRLQILKILK
jgi:hypothetical protein